MVNHWCSTKGKSLQDSFIAEMLNAQITIDFSRKVVEIIRKRQPKFSHMDEWDPNEVLRIREFNKDIECGVNLFVTLKNLYKKEFNDIEAVESAIKATADIMSDTMLVKFGWVKEECNGTVYT